MSDTNFIVHNKIWGGTVPECTSWLQV